jgi:hypothetical protein
MSFNQQSATERAKKDLAKRLKISADAIKVSSVSDQEFPNSSLGAGVGGEMAMQMISSGWEIFLSAEGKSFEYRADKYQVRLYKFNGKNYLVESL